MDAIERAKHAAHQRKYVHGLSKAKAQVTKYGIRAIDGRSKRAYALKAWRTELIADLGGEDNVTVQQRTIVELASTTKMIISSIDAWIVSQQTLIRRDQSLIPAVLQRQQLANGLRDDLKAIGLHRRVKTASLTEILSAQNEPDSDLANDGEVGEK